MEPQIDSWVTETQSTLKGVTTASLTGQHSRLRRAKERENWYNTGLSDDGKLVKPFKFVDQLELQCQNNSKLLSSIRSHVKQNTYIKRQATKTTARGFKQPHFLHVLPKAGPAMNFRVDSKTNNARKVCSLSSSGTSRPDESNRSCVDRTFGTFTGYGPLHRPRAAFLLSHYRETASKAWYPESVEACIEWSRSNTILLHAILYCAACHIRIVTNSEDYSDIFYHRGEAMKIINESLEDPIARVSNETIGGLCHLVMTEEVYGSRRAAAVHRKGLQKLFDLRRAIPGVSMNAIVYHLLPLTNLRLPSENTLLQSNGRLLGQENEDKEPNSRKDPILEVFAWLKDTPLQLPIHPSKNDCHSSLVRVKLEYNLYSHKGYDNSDRSRRCWLLAALIYLHTIIATPAGWHLLPKFEAHLIQELRNLLDEMVSEPSGHEPVAEIHLWILLFGGVHARGSDAAWYREAVSQFCNTQSLEQWDNVKQLLEPLPWIQADVEIFLKTFYMSCLTNK